jgi:hypothetical protein
MCPGKEALIAFVFGELSSDDILSHIKECQKCQGLVSEYKMLWNALSSLQNISVDKKIATDTFLEKKNKKNYYKSYVSILLIYFVIFLPIFGYFYIVESKKVSPSRSLTDASTINYTLRKIAQSQYKGKWLFEDINSVCSAYKVTFSDGYIQGLLSYVNEIPQQNIEEKAFQTTNLYELAIIGYYISQELKIKKIIGEKISDKALELLKNILVYFSISQNSDGGFGIHPRDSKSIPQVAFWVGLFLRNYIFLHGQIPYNIYRNMKKYLLKENSVISEFIKVVVFNKEAKGYLQRRALHSIEEMLATKYLESKKDEIVGMVIFL